MDCSVHCSIVSVEIASDTLTLTGIDEALTLFLWTVDCSGKVVSYHESNEQANDNASCLTLPVRLVTSVVHVICVIII